MWKLAVVSVTLVGMASGQVTQRVSVSSGAAEGDLDSYDWVGSTLTNGRFVAFTSFATNLVASDTNGYRDAFVRDGQTGTTERVSVATGGAQANENSLVPAISADGRFVAFMSFASNLVPGDTNLAPDIFVRDRQTGTTERVSVATGGAEGDGRCFVPVISPDGRFVAFMSEATNLVAGDTNGQQDVFVRDRQSGTTERVSVATGGAEADSNSTWPSISPDGRFVAFLSYATNLVAGDTNAQPDIFVRDRQSGTTDRVSVATGGTEGNSLSDWPSISADGRFVGFQSNSTNLVAGDTNGSQDDFVRDRQSGTTERVSLATGGAEGDSSSYEPSLSSDGRFVAFASQATNLVAGDTNGQRDAFVRDRQSGTTERVSVDTGGTEGNSLSDYPLISADGRFVLFSSYASNLVVGDTNGVEDVFLRDRDATGFTSLCDPGVGGVIPCPCSNPPAGTGRGCDNFGAGPADSGTLTAIGVAYLSMDTVLLTATGENDTSLTVFWTGKGPPSSTGVAHGAGVRCVTQALKRLYTHSAVGGTVSAPVGGDLSVSSRTAQVYANVPIAAGETRYYFAIYRDHQAAGPCGNTASTINLTNAGAITWNL